MTQEQIQIIFKNRYNQANWKQFLGEAFAKAHLLPVAETLDEIDTHVAVQAQKLGYIFLNENGIERQIAVYDVTLADGIVLERNRVGLRNLLRKFWKNIDAAFIVYHRPDTAKWRFTFVSELTGYDADGEFIKIKTEPKRYTYVLGEGESTRTASERFAGISAKGSRATLDDVKDAFSVEKLSKTFFDEYKKHYDIFCNFMVSKPNIRQTIFNGDEKAIRDFNKKLLGRIVFLYFIQKKGWLGVPEKSKWGEGKMDFINYLFEKCNNPDLFYTEYLSKLFFDTLNTKREYDITELVKGEPCRIPYLNGGLFEEDDPKHRQLIFPANLFKSLFDFFNQYNFTIYEDDPNDHTVAVDPEMLGHIFENLLEDNKDKGAFYTPKEIVHYMCQESLIEYLTTWFQNKGYEIIGYTTFGKPAEPQLFPVNEGRKGQMLLETEVKTQSKQIDRILIEKLLKKKLDDDDKKLIIEHAREFNYALDAVKICDPAIGSGAFPIGLLHEIFTAKQTLHTFEHGNTNEFPASVVKLNIIQNSIYGVDIEKGAVDIARLRFWLSLIVDEETPKTLPNLDYKIVVGNSLVSKLGDDIVDINWDIKEGVGKAGEYLKILKQTLLKLSQKQKEYFTVNNKNVLKEEIRNLKIDILINQLAFNKEQYANKNTIKNDMGFGLKPADIKSNLDITLTIAGFNNSINKLQKLKDQPDIPLQFFDWKLDFPEVMNDQVTEKIGFDIIIGNPPYGAKFNATDKAFFQNKYQTAKTIKDVQKGSLDTFTLFIDLGHNLATKGGNLHYIVPISITSSDSMTGVHRLIESDCSQIKVSSYSVRPQPVFENAVVNTSILYFKKDGIPCNKILSTKMYRKNKNFSLERLIDNLEFIDVFRYKLNGRYPKISYDIERNILDKIFSQKKSINQLIKPDGNPIYYRTTGGRYFKIVTTFSTGSTKETNINIDNRISKSIGAILSSNLYFWFYQIYSNNLDLKYYEVITFKLPYEKITDSLIKEIETIYDEYLKDIEANSNVRQTTNYANIDSFKEYKIGKSKHLIDKIDDIICPLYGLTEEELNFIKNYEIQYRLSDEEVKVIDPDFTLTESEYEAIDIGEDKAETQEKITNYELRITENKKDGKERKPNKKDSDFYEDAMGMDWGNEE